MNKNYFQRVHEQTATKFWINNVTRSQAHMAIEAGAVGCTQNPAYTWKMMCSEEEKGYVSEKLAEILRHESDDNAAMVALQHELIGGVAKIFNAARRGKCFPDSLLPRQDQGDTYRLRGS